MRPPTRPGLWLDRALCVLVALAAAVALFVGIRARHHGLAGMAISALVGAAWAAQVLFDDAALTRARALRAAIVRASHARGRNP